MKLHLPLALLSALLSSLISLAVEIPDDYELVKLHSTSDLNPYTSNTSDDKYGFILDSDLVFTPISNTSWTSNTSLCIGGFFHFSSKYIETPVILELKNGKSCVFEQTSSLEFNSFYKLTISSNVSAIKMKTGGSLYLRNINDSIYNK